ncbi:MAG TPA: hypothetical protein VHO70_25005 [Chitinispirillaceae bacterium]|nr:hypothetical protein [Chitinispirillaceae bacterium]
MKNKTSILNMILIGCCILCAGCTWPLENPSDSESSKCTVESAAFITAVEQGPYYQNSKVRFRGGITSDAVEKKGLVQRYEWDFGCDGIVDTVLYKTDLLWATLEDTGKYSVSIRLVDRAGYSSWSKVTINVKASSVNKPETLEIPDIKILFPDVELPIDTTCALYAQNKYTIRPVIYMGKYFTYKNKTESMELGNFVFELLKNLTGTIDYNALAMPSKTGFNNGVYTFSNGNLTMKAAFLYGPGLAGHNENDTICYDLFDPHSYIKSFGVQLISPYYTIEKGPLWDLTSGFSVDVSNRLSPRITLSIAFGSLKFTGSRDVESRYTMSTEMTDSNQVTIPVFDPIAFRYHGLAKIEPFFIRGIVNMVEHDSLQIDMTGSVIVTDSFPAKFTVHTTSSDSSVVKIMFMLTQTMLDQKVRFGNSGGDRKVIGSYAAESQLTLNKLSMVKSYFKGAYSTFAADTVSFFCDQEMNSQFGTLFVGVPQTGYLTFVSDRYTYQFTVREGVVQ